MSSRIWNLPVAPCSSVRPVRNVFAKSGKCSKAYERVAIDPCNGHWGVAGVMSVIACYRQLANFFN